MKREIQIYAWLAALLVLMSVLPLDAIVVTPGSGPYRPGAVISFRATNPQFRSAYRADWNFGDGTVFNTTSGLETVTHAYNQAGTYTITVIGRFTSSGPITETVTLNVAPLVDNRSITVSPAILTAGQPATFTAHNFNTPKNINWEMGDGTKYSTDQENGGFKSRMTGGSVVTHTYAAAGTYQVRAYDWAGDTNTPVTLTVTVQAPNRQVRRNVASPRVDQPVLFHATNFLSTVIDWNFGDGTVQTGVGVLVWHRFAAPGTYVVSARDAAINHTPATNTVVVLEENRYIVVSPPEVRVNLPVSVQAFNFRGNLIAWNFGDGAQKSGGHTESHTYTRPGTFTITARDENGQSQVPFTATVRVRGIDDVVNLEMLEVRLDNGKYYKVVPRKSKDIAAILRMRMNGSGIVSGYWEVDGHPFEFFNETVSQGDVKEIITRKIPGLPTLNPGVHTVAVRLTRPMPDVQLPTLKYYVLPYDGVMAAITPVDGFVAKDSQIPKFAWEPAQGASRYQIAFCDNLWPIMQDNENLEWIDNQLECLFTPGAAAWNKIRRNAWTYWKVRALDTFGNVLAESAIQEIKVVVAEASVSVLSVSDIDGNPADVVNDSAVCRAGGVLVRGAIVYPADAEFLVLRVYTSDQLTDQLLFRNVRKNESLSFETSAPHSGPETRIYFQVLKTSSPAVVVGVHSLTLIK